ncbi:MAG: hypothetical protein M3342_09035 [Bacteroidota bacterium]|nr:hypothetical protein [Bacteroidota bacterium]
MAILQLKPHLTVEQLKERMHKERQVHHFKRWQILHAIATHKGWATSLSWYSFILLPFSAIHVQSASSHKCTD